MKVNPQTSKYWDKRNSRQWRHFAWNRNPSVGDEYSPLFDINPRILRAILSALTAGYSARTGIAAWYLYCPLVWRGQLPSTIRLQPPGPGQGKCMPPMYASISVLSPVTSLAGDTRAADHWLWRRKTRGRGKRKKRLSWQCHVKGKAHCERSRQRWWKA